RGKGHGVGVPGVTGISSAGRFCPRWHVVQFTDGFALFSVGIFLRYSLLMAMTMRLIARAVSFAPLSSESHWPATWQWVQFTPSDLVKPNSMIRSRRSAVTPLYSVMFMKTSTAGWSSLPAIDFLSSARALVWSNGASGVDAGAGKDVGACAGARA